jgi:23S rRNA (adenine2503-C2)-methyltransferase
MTETASHSDTPNAGAAARRHLFGETPESLEQWLTAEGHPRYRATQILEWIYPKRVASFDAMTNLSKALRVWLADQADLYRSQVVTESIADDGTRKLLLSLPDGATTETVWIPDRTRHTTCISSQVGCPVGCRFCASGTSGLGRNLTTGEIVEQVVRIQRLVAEHAPADDDGRPARLSNIVLMGMGEPLANYDAVLAALRIINAPWGPNIGARKITLSTVGLPKQIRQLADEGLQINLALSLHAPNQVLREELIPWGRVPIEDLLDACRYFFDQTGREITLEYVLLDGVNDAQRDAADLARIARSLRCNVNLLRYNPVPGLPYQRPSAEAAYQFQQQLREMGVNAHLRTSRGRDIDAACGQLRRRVAESGLPIAGATGGD